MTEERVILADCCEDWILEWGGFYEPGASFSCPECDTGWTKRERGAFRRADGREFVRRERRGPDDAFRYLAAADGHEPLVERCCAKILLAHGSAMADGRFTCPVCRTAWERRTDRVHGLRLPTFDKEGLREPLAIQAGRTRPFLVGLSEWTPTRD
ncbi:MAG TPA: hypothetical protein VFM93_03595 [Candidatus Limnocylindria bacterium]|nr:hypothetical protein [Candidatus Limnocylindria bacterium]